MIELIEGGWRIRFAASLIEARPFRGRPQVAGFKDFEFIGEADEDGASERTKGRRRRVKRVRDPESDDDVGSVGMRSKSKRAR